MDSLQGDFYYKYLKKYSVLICAFILINHFLNAVYPLILVNYFGDLLGPDRKVSTLLLENSSSMIYYLLGIAMILIIRSDVKKDNIKLSGSVYIVTFFFFEIGVVLFLFFVFVLNINNQNSGNEFKN